MISVIKTSKSKKVNAIDCAFNTLYKLEGDNRNLYMRTKFNGDVVHDTTPFFIIFSIANDTINVETIRPNVLLMKVFGDDIIISNEE